MSTKQELAHDLVESFLNEIRTSVRFVRFFVHLRSPASQYRIYVSNEKKRYLLRNFYAHLALAHLNIKLKMCTMNEVKATVQQKSFRNITIHTITRNCELNERKKREDR